MAEIHAPHCPTFYNFIIVQNVRNQTVQMSLVETNLYSSIWHSFFEKKTYFNKVWLSLPLPRMVTYNFHEILTKISILMNPRKF